MRIKKLFFTIFLSLSLLFSQSSCFLTLNLLQSYGYIGKEDGRLGIPDRKNNRTKIYSDKVTAVSSFKDDERLALISDDTVYLINDKNLNDFLINNAKSLNQDWTINALDLVYVSKDSNKAQLSFELTAKATKEKKLFNSEIEVYKNKGVSPRYPLTSGVKVNIYTKYEGEKDLPPMILPLPIALVLDAVLILLGVVITGA